MNPKPSPLMMRVITQLSTDWGPYPGAAYIRTINAMRARGLIEERFTAEGIGHRWEYRLTAEGAKHAAR